MCEGKEGTMCVRYCVCVKVDKTWARAKKKVCQSPFYIFFIFFSISLPFSARFQSGKGGKERKNLFFFCGRERKNSVQSSAFVQVQVSYRYSIRERILCQDLCQFQDTQRAIAPWGKSFSVRSRCLIENPLLFFFPSLYGRV